MKIGDRVRLHPDSDPWVQGTRQGTIIGILPFRGEGAPMYRVVLDAPNVRFWYHLCDLMCGQTSWCMLQVGHEGDCSST